MQKFIAILFTAICAFCAYGQGTNTQQQSSESADKHVIYIDIPKRYPIEDKIILVNNSPYTIVQAVVVLDDAANPKVLGSTSYVMPGCRKEMASFSDEWLKKIRGKRLAIKIKGVDKVIGDNYSTKEVKGGFPYGITSGSREETTVSAEELNSLKDEAPIYDFNVAINADHNDLLINVSGGGGGNIFGF